MVRAWLLLATTLSLAFARTKESFDPVTIATEEALADHPWLRRDPACAASSAGSGGAAKVLHQLWWQGEAQIPKHFAPLRETWATQHPTWERKLWDEAMVVALVNASYEWFAPTFHALPSKIQKADAARYMILHAEGGVYADLDVESFRPLDELLTAPALQLFEEPYPHWEAHKTVVSNGLMMAPKGNPLLMRILRAIRPKAQVFATTGSHMMQEELMKCHVEETPVEDHDSEDAEAAAAILNEAEAKEACGCYITHIATAFFPLHAAMRSAASFGRVGEHADAAREWATALSKSKWPPEGTFTAQYWTASWIDPDLGALWLNGIAAARVGNQDKAENFLVGAVWSKWGHKYRYNRESSEEADRAEDAFKRSLHYQPTYPFAYYELGNIALEASGGKEHGSKDHKKKLQEAESHYAAAVRLSPTSLLFHNNLGVSRMNLNKPAKALPSFQRVLQLHPTTFAAIQGLDPEGGAHLNIGIAMINLGRKKEAYSHWHSAIKSGSFEYALQAAQRFVANGANDQLPPDSELDFQFGETLARAGRTREAALWYAAAHKNAVNLTAAVGEGSMETMRAQVQERMERLARDWTEGDGALAQRTQNDKPTKLEDLEVTQADADGTTRKIKMTPEMVDQLKQQAQSK